MSSSSAPDNSVAENLCLACGLCCNGAVFARVKLQPQDDPVRLQSLGLRLTSPRGAPPASPPIPNSAFHTPHLKQPCAAFDGCRCRIYAERPTHCRQFECLLLKRVQEGRTGTAAALATIRAARQGTETVRRLLRALGDTDEQTALSARFRRMARRMEKLGPDSKTAETFGELTVAVHELNLTLSQNFYPGE